jgi:WXXGXW repeat (2 copies)
VALKIELLSAGIMDAQPKELFMIASTIGLSRRCFSGTGFALALGLFLTNTSPAKAWNPVYGPPIIRGHVIVVAPSSIVGPPAIAVAPPVPLAPMNAPRSGWTWTGGYWRWTGADYAWVASASLPMRPGYLYSPARWEMVRGGWTFVPGHWVVAAVR